MPLSDTTLTLTKADFCHLMHLAAAEKRRHYSPGTPQFDAYRAEAEFWAEEHGKASGALAEEDDHA
jgi:hypothetical protein